MNIISNYDEKEELKPRYIPEKTVENTNVRYVKNPKVQLSKYKDRIIGASIATVVLFFLTYVPIFPFHLIIVGTDYIIPGGISLGWIALILLIYYIMRYYGIGSE